MAFTAPKYDKRATLIRHKRSIGPGLYQTFNLTEEYNKHPILGDEDNCSLDNTIGISNPT